MFSLTIGSPIDTPVHKDCFIVTCEAMNGDADGSEFLEVGPFKNTDEHRAYLEEFLRFCEKMKNTYGHGEWGSGTQYRDLVPDFEKWFAETDDQKTQHDNGSLEDIYLDLTSGFAGWPMDPLTDYTQEANFRDYVVHYFDVLGTKHDVEVSF